MTSKSYLLSTAILSLVLCGAPVGAMAQQDQNQNCSDQSQDCAPAKKKHQGQERQGGGEGAQPQGQEGGHKQRQGGDHGARQQENAPAMQGKSQAGDQGQGNGADKHGRKKERGNAASENAPSAGSQDQGAADQGQQGEQPPRKLMKKERKAKSENGAAQGMQSGDQGAQQGNEGVNGQGETQKHKKKLEKHNQQGLQPQGTQEGGGAAGSRKKPERNAPAEIKQGQENQQAQPNGRESGAKTLQGQQENQGQNSAETPQNQQGTQENNQRKKHGAGMGTEGGQNQNSRNQQNGEGQAGKNGNLQNEQNRQNLQNQQGQNGNQQENNRTGKKGPMLPGSLQGAGQENGGQKAGRQNGTQQGAESGQQTNRRHNGPRTDASAQVDINIGHIRPITEFKGRRMEQPPEFLIQPTEPNGARIVNRSRDRAVIEIDNRLVIQHTTDRLLTRDARNVYYEDLPHNEVSVTVVRPDGSRIVTIRNRYGDVVRRSRIMPDGREYVLIYVPDQYRDERHGWIAPEDLPPPPRISEDEYVLTAAPDYGPDRYYEYLDQPPVEPIHRIYTLDQVRHSERLLSVLPRVDLEIHFATGSAEIDRSQYNVLQGIAEAMSRILRRNPAETFLVEGYTDAVGDAQQNLVLSDDRADSVAQILIQNFNIPPENLVTQGYGETNLKVQTDGPSQQNRRVAIQRITPLVAPMAQQ